MFIISSDPTNKVGSTDQLLYFVELLNTDMRNSNVVSRELIVGSMDITALYGSISTRKAV